MSNQKCQKEYIQRIHKVQDYIELHLGQALSITELADTAGYSKYHFCRIFQGILQEPLAHYVNRIRMERALFLLAHRADKNMTDIAYELGLSKKMVVSIASLSMPHAKDRIKLIIEYIEPVFENCV